MITPTDIRIANYVIIESGAADKFNAALRSDRGGRTPSFDQSLFLLGMLLSAREHGKIHIRLIHTVLTSEVPIDQQYAWGIRKRKESGETWVISEADLQNVSRSLKRALNYGVFLPAKYRENPEEIERRKATLEEIVDTLIDSTLIPRPKNAMDYAIDDTGIWASERARRLVPSQDEEIIEGDEETTPLPALPDTHPAGQDEEVQEQVRVRARRTQSDAGYGVKTNKDGKRTWYFGYALHALVRVPNESADGIRSEASLVERIRLTPAGTDIVEVSLNLIDSVRGKNQRIRHLLADRHYSYKKLDRWLYPLIERGIEPVVQLRKNDHGFREWDGMLFAAGHAHCPATPTHLGEIQQPPPKGKAEKWEKFFKLNEERQAYATQRTQKLKTDGTTRWRCPALNGSIGCPLRAGTVQAARTLGLPIVASPPKQLPRICTEDSVGLKVETEEQAVIIKMHQKHYWGSRRQVALNGRRTFVEGWFGTLKGDSSAAKRRGSSLYTGIAHATIETAIFSCVANIIQLRAWHDETELGATDHPLLTPEFANHGFRYLTADEHPLADPERHG